MGGEERVWNIELREAEPVEEELRAFVNEARAGEGLEERSAEVWRWRAEAPGGAIVGSARDDAGELRAAVCVVRHPAILEGEVARFGEVVEVANAFAKGRGLVRAAPLAALLEAFGRVYCGAAPEGMPFLYGVPTRRAHRFLRGRAKAEVLRAENVLWAQPSGLEWLETGVEVTESEGAPEELDAFFMEWRRSKPAVLVRGRDEYAWRFRDHPTRSYRCALARRMGEVVGCAVLRMGEVDGEAGGILADWMTMPGDRECGMELLRWAREAVGGTDRLFVNVSDRSGEFALFQSLGFRVRGTDEYLAFRGFRRPTVMSWLFANWTYTLFDSERG
ncbi:MAG TPA: hypothetical protein ENJ09_03720 [Planctomycetes bacterium]|nr:hypothetical protein [Planctomycetota bacterium]